MPPQLSFADCAELTGINASTALNALGCVDNVGILNCAADCVCGTLSCAECAALTLVSVNNVVKKALTYACGALLINNVRNVFVTEELECCKNGVGSSLAETAK